MMLHIKFDKDWPSGLRDIQVWKCGWEQWKIRAIAHFFSAFGSGELEQIQVF